MKIDRLESISTISRYGNVEVAVSASAPTAPSSGMMWYEIGDVNAPAFPQPWIWNSNENIWLSSPFVLDFGYIQFSIASTGSTSWVNRTLPFYANTSNRIILRHIFGNIYNVGSIAHNADRFYTFFLDRFLGSGLMEPTVTLTPNTVDIAAVSYTNQTNPDIPFRPNSASLRRITMTNLNLWMPGNTWYQRLRATRGGATTGDSGSIAISLIQILQFARL